MVVLHVTTMHGLGAVVITNIHVCEGEREYLNFLT